MTDTRRRYCYPCAYHEYDADGTQDVCDPPFGGCALLLDNRNNEYIMAGAVAFKAMNHADRCWATKWYSPANMKRWRDAEDEYKRLDAEYKRLGDELEALVKAADALKADALRAAMVATHDDFDERHEIARERQEAIDTRRLTHG